MADAPSQQAASGPIWVTFTSVTTPTCKPTSIILSLSNNHRREYSHLVPVTLDGTLTKPIQTSLRPDVHKIALHVHCQTSSPRPTRPITTTLTLDARRLALSATPTQNTISAADGTQLTFTAAREEAACGDDGCAEVVAVDAEAGSGSPDKRTPDVSFSSVSEDDGLDDLDRSVRGLSHSRRVSFNSRISEIPTTEGLQRSAESAKKERTAIWHSVSDLAVQVASLHAEVRGLRDGAHSSVAKRSRPRHARMARRRAVLDGDMIACAFGDGTFRSEGLVVALEYFLSRGVKAVAVVSESRLRGLEGGGKDADVERRRVADLKGRRLVCVCPSHKRRGGLLLRYAVDHDADIVSNLWAAEESSVSSGGSGSVGSGHGRKEERWFVDDHVTGFMFIAGRFVPEVADGLDRPSSWPKAAPSDSSSACGRLAALNRCSTW